MNSCLSCQPTEEPDTASLDKSCLEDYGRKVHQATLRDEVRDRNILYATCGNPKGDPILFFPPLGGTRRVILVLREALEKHSLWAICVSRPGSEGTTAANTARSQVEIFAQDSVAVLDDLKINRAGILCMCAGTPFAMAFCARYHERTTGKFLALGPWVQVADCPISKPLERFAACYLPIWGVSSIVGSLQCIFINLSSKIAIARKLREKSSFVEQKYLQDRYGGQADTLFGRDLEWALGTLYNESMDISVCLSSSADLGFSYKDLDRQDILIWQGTNDNIAYPPASQWLEKQLPHAALHFIPDSTHQGALFLLGPDYMDSLSHLTTKFEISCTTLDVDR